MHACSWKCHDVCLVRVGEHGAANELEYRHIEGKSYLKDQLTRMPGHDAEGTRVPDRTKTLELSNGYGIASIVARVLKMRSLPRGHLSPA
jgi:hypothetical protein